MRPGCRGLILGGRKSSGREVAGLAWPDYHAALGRGSMVVWNDRHGWSIVPKAKPGLTCLARTVANRVNWPPAARSISTVTANSVGHPPPPTQTSANVKECGCSKDSTWIRAMALPRPTGTGPTAKKKVRKLRKASWSSSPARLRIRPTPPVCLQVPAPGARQGVAARASSASVNQ